MQLTLGRHININGTAGKAPSPTGGRRTTSFVHAGLGHVVSASRKFLRDG